MHPYQYSGFKLWTGAGNDELIISAHGGRSLLGGREVLSGFEKKKVPNGMELVFYGPDRAALVTSTIKHAFFNHNLAGHPYKVKSSGDSYVDYELTKYQGSHGGLGETYNEVQQCLARYDVLTIRHRPAKLGGPMMLSDILEALIKDNRIYKKVHCAFCRAFRELTFDLLKGRPDYRPAKN